MGRYDGRLQEYEALKTRMEVLGDIYEKLENEMKWDTMVWHEKDEEHDGVWFTDVDESDSLYEWKMSKRDVWNEVLDLIDKLAKK